MEKPKVLLIDDDPDFVEAITLVLQNNGYEVISASTGPEGLAKAKGEGVHLIILDVMMSRATEGFEVLNELRSEEKTRKIPVMMLTAVGSRFPGAKFDKEQLPADLLMEKPVRPGELLSRIEALLEK